MTKEIKMSGKDKPTKVGTYKRRVNANDNITTYSYWNGEYWGPNHNEKDKVSFNGKSMWQGCDWYKEQEFKSMKFRTPTPEISEAVQKWLFEQGYKWSGWEQKVCYDSSNFLYTDTHGYLGFGDTEEYFEGHGGQEMQVVSKVYYEFVPVSPETVEFNGKKYDKKKLEDALALLKPIEE